MAGPWTGITLYGMHHMHLVQLADRPQSFCSAASQQETEVMERIAKPFLDNHIQALLHEQLAALQLLRCSSPSFAWGAHHELWLIGF